MMQLGFLAACGTDAVQEDQIPSPTITSLNRDTATAGTMSTGFVVYGTEFHPSSIVNWNGAATTTLYANDTALSAYIPGGQVNAVGVHQVTVYNDPEHISNAVTFTILAAPATIPIE